MSPYYMGNLLLSSLGSFNPLSPAEPRMESASVFALAYELTAAKPQRSTVVLIHQTRTLSVSRNTNQRCLLLRGLSGPPGRECEGKITLGQEFPRIR